MICIGKYNKKVDSEADLIRLLELCYKRVKYYFTEDVDRIDVYFCYSRSEFNKYVRKETPEWMVGVSGKTEIVIFSPAVIAKVSKHPTSDIAPVLTHEIVHVFTNQLFAFTQPKWLVEGLAGYIAGQYKKHQSDRIRPTELKLLHTQIGWKKLHNYKQAFLFTAYLMKKFGKRKIFKLIASLGKHDSYNVFCSKFKIAIGFKLENCFKDWLFGMQEKGV